jgi:hypothetical protein
MIDLASVTAEDFQAWAQEPFTLARPTGAPLHLRVAEVAPGKPRPGERTPFAVLFHAPPDADAPQDIHHLDHPVAGALDLFLVPLGARDGQARYEAIFG